MFIYNAGIVVCGVGFFSSQKGKESVNAPVFYFKFHVIMLGLVSPL